MEFEVNSDINSKVSKVKLYCNSDFSKGVVGGAIHEAARPGLLDECQKLNGCETGECMVTLGYKLPAKYVFNIV